jgi:hypothetical protein
VASMVKMVSLPCTVARLLSPRSGLLSSLHTRLQRPIHVRCPSPATRAGGRARRAVCVLDTYLRFFSIIVGEVAAADVEQAGIRTGPAMRFRTRRFSV